MSDVTSEPASIPANAPAAERTTGEATLPAVVLAAADRHTGPAITGPGGAGRVALSFAEVGDAVREIARGLISLGIAPGDRVSILCETRLEWTLCDFGALCAGATVAPIYHTNSPGECAHVLSHSGARAVFCENEAQLAKVREIRDRCPELEHVLLIEGEASDALSLAELRRRGAEVDAGAVDERVAAVGPDDVASFVYTSGTTGPPKGCMLTHGNFVSTMSMYAEVLELRRGEQPVIYLFLPLAHALARVAAAVAIDVGGTLAFWSGDSRRLAADLAEIRPTHLPAVPRVYEKVQATIEARTEEQGALRRRLFTWALGRGRAVRERERRGEPVPAAARAAHALADRLVLSKIRELFGGRLELALVGAAPMRADVLEFFDACGVLVLEGYGMTETTAASTLNTPHAVRFGTVGRPLPGTDVRIADDGEVLLRGPHVFRGYYKDEAATSETLVDGWVRTGDLGELDDAGFLRITGRKKELIITSSGKNVSPVALENALRASPWISEAVVYGDDRPYLVALLTLDPAEAPTLAASLGVSGDIAALARDPRVREAVQADVDAANAQFARIEQIKRFAILDRELSEEEGELTPTMKVKRNIVERKFGDLFASLYES